MRYALLISCLTVGALGQPVSPLRATEAGQDYQCTLDWENGYVEVTGEATCDPTLSVNLSHCYSMASKAARALAYEKLTETVHGVSVTSSNTFRDEVVHNTTLRTAVQGLIRDARIVREEREVMPDGSVLVRVTLGVMIYGPAGLGAAVARHSTPEASSPQVRKLRADLDRALAELAQAREQAKRLEGMVEELSKVPRHQAPSPGTEEALRQASAALRLAQEAQRAVEALTQATSSAAQRAQGSPQAASEVMEAVREARALAESLMAAAREARAAAGRAQEASEAAKGHASRAAEAWEAVQRATGSLEQLRGELQRLRQDQERVLSRLATARVAADSTLARTLDEVQRLRDETRRTRQQVVWLEQQVREGRLAADSAAAISGTKADSLTRRVEALGQELAAARARQLEWETRTAAALEEALRAVQASSAQAGSESAAQLRQLVAQGAQLQQAVANLEKRATEAEAEVAKLWSSLAQASPPAYQKVVAEATVLGGGLQHAADSLRTSPRPSVKVVDVPSTTYTGLIVDASYLNASPAIKPRIYSVDGEEVYGESRVLRTVFLRLGRLAGYTDTPSTAKAKLVSLLGPNPLVIKAIDATGQRRSDLVISREDALMIERANEVSGFLKECKVAITLEPSA